ncbi:hypothetical protein EF847_03775 [Actinobacteria bacterium YIM 96077]|uniref:Uncharacterized protein n=1 Tax=Phytoactinopolyspora halophila TaxID=1981511 RepID=A0A329R417_9ACTN|nr:hypothetical protein [Phytoactinopolyspora halophila]AYY11957.1 hypothetical protein EF847_03775 [Actinobacteria bacterium YIM 96077]RAW18809.1 hypothetical protein DPM12_01735 [Phytoactinopolyspora halophila]
MVTINFASGKRAAWAGYPHMGTLEGSRMLMGVRLDSLVHAPCQGLVRPQADFVDAPTFVLDRTKGGARVRSLGPPD